MAQTLLITGIRGLGRTIALHFAARGWHVLCASRTRSEVEALAGEVDKAGGTGEGMTLELRDPGALRALAERRIDLCIASQTTGGRFGFKPLLEIDGEELDAGYQTMLRGTWNLLQAVGPGMVARGSGTFLQMGTSSGVRTRDGFAPLGAIQHGLRALVQVAAREWRPRGVHVAYVVIDGGIDSGRMRAAGVDPAVLLEPAEIARACEYLHGQQPRSWTHELLLRPNVGEWTTPT
jgi:NAD(P)-dependent dehydrogenase (short-subunit alcohol dehydrogenase family)